jgi:hypothetical protein
MKNTCTVARLPARSTSACPPVDLGSDRGRVDLRHEHIPCRVTELAPALAHVIADRRLGDLGAVLVDEAPPDALRRVALLARRVKISDQPRVDQLAIRAQLRRRPRHRRPLRRRQRRRKRRPDGPAVHAMALGQRAQRHVLALAITTDLLELFHSGSHFLPAPDPRSMSTGASADHRTRWGQFKPSQWGQMRPSFLDSLGPGVRP